MKTFFLLRHDDIHGNSGEGVVAEGCIFDNGMVAMTWLTEHESLTFFKNITTVKKLHGHNGRTEVILESKDRRFQTCKEEVRNRKLQAKQKEKVDGEN